MTAERSSTPRGQDRGVISRGGRRLARLLEDMVALDVICCRVRVHKGCLDADMVLVKADGTEVTSYDWTGRGFSEAILLLLDQASPSQGRSSEPDPVRGEFVLDGATDLLPPGMDGLRCAYSLLPPPNRFLDLHVLTDGDAAPEHRPARDKSTLRDPEPVDLWRGGRLLSQLLIDMYAGDASSCEIRMLKGRGDFRLGYRDGDEMPWCREWSAMEVLGAVEGSARSKPRLLPRSNRPLTRNRFEPWRNQTRPMEERTLETDLGEMEFLIEPQTGLLPPEIPVLLCQFGILPVPGMYLMLRVMTEEEARAWEANMAAAEFPMRTIREDG